MNKNVSHAMRISYLSILLAVPPGLAKERLLPTGVNAGDCVAPIISIAKTTAHKSFDRRYCTQNNRGNSPAIKTCERNSITQKQVAFFTDRCTQKSYYIGINGVDYQLRRTNGNPDRPPYLTGSFVGDGIKVKVTELRSIKKKNDDGVESGESLVLVTISQGKNTEKFEGVASFGP
jgi:hypothetical protein